MPQLGTISFGLALEDGIARWIEDSDRLLGGKDFAIIVTEFANFNKRIFEGRKDVTPT